MFLFHCFHNARRWDSTSAIMLGPQILLRSTPGQVGFLYRIRCEQHHNTIRVSRGPAELSVILWHLILIIPNISIKWRLYVFKEIANLPIWFVSKLEIPLVVPCGASIVLWFRCPWRSDVLLFIPVTSFRANSNHCWDFHTLFSSNLTELRLQLMLLWF